MGKKIVLLVLLLLVVGGAVWQNIYVAHSTTELTEHLKKIRAALETDDFAAAAAAADEFSLSWEEKERLYEALFEHKEVDSISASVKSIKSYCYSGSKEDALAYVSETEFYIEHIKGIDTLGWENVF